MAFSFDLGLAISAERYGAISAGPEHIQILVSLRELFKQCLACFQRIIVKQKKRINFWAVLRFIFSFGVVSGCKML